MNREEFNRLSYPQKTLAVFTEGTFVAQRPFASYYADLFHLPGDYFVECFYHKVTQQLIGLRSLVPSYAYASYLASIDLPAGLL